MKNISHDIVSGFHIRRGMDNGMLLPHEHKHPNHSLVYKPGFGPYPVQDPDPSFRKCFSNFGPSEYTIWAVTAAVPSYLGFRVTGTYRH